MESTEERREKVGVHDGSRCPNDEGKGAISSIKITTGVLNFCFTVVDRIAPIAGSQNRRRWEANSTVELEPGEAN
jgi:hypothetical protein